MSRPTEATGAPATHHHRGGSDGSDGRRPRARHGATDLAFVAAFFVLLLIGQSVIILRSGASASSASSPSGNSPSAAIIPPGVSNAAEVEADAHELPRLATARSDGSCPAAP